MTNPVTVEAAATSPAPEAPPALEAARPIEGRSPGQIAWLRLRRDKAAMASAAVIGLLILVAIAAPLLTALNGHGPNEFHQEALNTELGGIPKGRFGGISSEFWLGVEPGTGRDVFSRIVYGARISLVVATLATLVAVGVGTVVGVTAGYFGGWVDQMSSRTMDVILAFQQLLFAIALVAVADQIPRTLLIVLVIGFLNWPYIGRIVRGQTLSLREREFVEAARSLGAGHAHIIFKQLLPNLAAPILVYSTMIIPANILFEAAMSFLGVGVKPPTPSWGQMLSNAVSWYSTDPVYVAVPGLALFVTVLAFNLLGDGLRDALDPRGGR